ncbi:MAG: hypothetical protein K2Q18_08125 [Bdellovibrionales bacterium]|nr:hypothetical protein [Bdellovibrionales bacterium]
MQKYLLITLSIYFFIPPAFSEQGYCSMFRECDNAIQSTSKSLPSSSSAINFNPSNISKINGFGAEILYQPNNPVGFNLLTGNGTFGGAIISPAAENSFFGNRPIEIDDIYANRRKDKKRYRTNKISIAIGASLINEEAFGFDIGLSLRRNPDIKKINPGLGFSTHIFFLNIGANFYRDDTKFDLGQYKNAETGVLYSTQLNASTYQETFLVKTFSAGLNFGALTLDASLMKTKYDFYPNETSIFIYSSSYNYEDFLFNIGYRTEISDNKKFNNGNLYKDREKKDSYGGIKYIWNSHFTTGISYNNFLIHDFSMTLNIFI